MRLCDRRHDRKAQTRARACSTFVGTTEPFEGTFRETVGKTNAFIAHLEDDGVAFRPSRDGDRAGAVPQRVVDEVSERLLDPQPVDVGGRVAVHFDCAPGFGRPPLITGRDAGHELLCIHLLQTKRQCLFVRAREEQQIGRKLREAVGRACNREQPSINAASSSSCGIVLKKPISSQIENGTVKDG